MINNKRCVAGVLALRCRPADGDDDDDDGDDDDDDGDGQSFLLTGWRRMDAEEARTIVVAGVPDDALDRGRMADKLVIHFQRARSGGGDVATIRYPTAFKGVAFITFEEQRDADRVLQMKQTLQDPELLEEYPLTVYPFSQDVFCYARAEVDLSLFSDGGNVLRGLQSTRRSVRVTVAPPHRWALVEGPFTAVRELREELSKQLVRLGGEGPVKSPMKQAPGAGAGECSVWLDSNVFRYVQHYHKEDLERISRKYSVERTTEVQGELTSIILTKSARGPSQLRRAHLELQELLADLQRPLRTQIIQYGRGDEAEREELAEVCEEAKLLCGRVLVAPLVPHIEVTGPPSDCLLFCQLVEEKRKRLPVTTDSDVGPTVGSSRYSRGGTGDPHLPHSGVRQGAAPQR
ncbi:RBM43 protein, partial [Atractosteus spatula]|nr:RBM43 protein [Atractosteus spatula]